MAPNEVRRLSPKMRRLSTYRDVVDEQVMIEEKLVEGVMPNLFAD